MGRLTFTTTNMKGLSPDVLIKEKLRSTFKKHDKNGDGKLSFEELQAAFRELGGGISWCQTEQGFRHADKNDNGYIDIEEELEALVDYNAKK
nr:calcium-binding protein cml37 [Quercus suber]POF10330.1 calcium-binding protein cml37 [Quercus suber]